MKTTLRPVVLSTLFAVAVSACANADVVSPIDALQPAAATVSAPIPVETVGAGVLPKFSVILGEGIDSDGHRWFDYEYATGPDATGEAVGSARFHTVVFDTTLVRTTVLLLRQRTGWRVEVPKQAVYDNKAFKAKWSDGRQSVTMTVLYEPGRTYLDLGTVR